jgi:hypothetical protein
VRLLKELPKLIRQSLDRRFHPKFLNPNKPIAVLFSWADTAEGAEIWCEVNKGKFEKWCEHHELDYEFIEIMNNEDKVIQELKKEKEIEDLEEIIKRIDGIYT